MSVTRKELVELLKQTKLPVFRDSAEDKTQLPYIVYSFIAEDIKKASSKNYKYMPLYQISLFTAGIEGEFRVILKLLDDNGIPFSTVSSIQGDENDDRITNFFCQVRCIEDE